MVYVSSPYGSSQQQVMTRGANGQENGSYWATVPNATPVNALSGPSTFSGIGNGGHSDNYGNWIADKPQTATGSGAYTPAGPGKAGTPAGDAALKFMMGGGGSQSADGTYWTPKDSVTNSMGGSAPTGYVLDHIIPNGGYVWKKDPAATASSETTVTGGYAAPTGASAAQSANPWSLAANQAAVAAGNASGQQAAGNLGQANTMRTSANALGAGASAVMNTAFDPQNALYNRTAQQTQDQMRVGQAARGITASPYGASLENSGMSNFNIDWQNQQLNRQVAGLGAAGTATNAAGTANTTGANLGQQGVAQTQAQGQLPYESYAQDEQTNIQNWLSYMNAQQGVVSGSQISYPQQLAQQAMLQGGGVPYIPQSNNMLTMG